MNERTLLIGHVAVNHLTIETYESTWTTAHHIYLAAHGALLADIDTSEYRVEMRAMARIRGMYRYIEMARACEDENGFHSYITDIRQNDGDVDREVVNAVIYACRACLPDWRA